MSYFTSQTDKGSLCSSHLHVIICILFHAFCLFASAAGQELRNVTVSPWYVFALVCVSITHSDTVSFASAENGIIKSDKVYEVMLATDRAHFSRCNPYMDSPQSIGNVSAPLIIIIIIITLKSKHTLTAQASANQLCASLFLNPTGYQATISAPHMVRLYLSDSSYYYFIP